MSKLAVDGYSNAVKTKEEELEPIPPYVVKHGTLPECTSTDSDVSVKFRKTIKCVLCVDIHQSYNEECYMWVMAFSLLQNT